MPKYSLLWVLGVAGVVCWVIKLLGCEAAGSLLLCSAPGLKCAQLCASDDCGANASVEHKKGVLSQLDSVANGGERRVYWPGYHQQAYCNVYCLRLYAAAF